MSAHSVLMILQVPENIRLEYQEGITRAFPDLEVNVVADAAHADPYLDRATILITHGPYMGARANHILAHAPCLQWVQGIGVGMDNIDPVGQDWVVQSESSQCITQHME